MIRLIEGQFDGDSVRMDYRLAPKHLCILSEAVPNTVTANYGRQGVRSQELNV